jgi:hypothetical protein
MGPISPGGTITGGGGAVQYRDPLDQARAAGGKLPYAEYPDGYLGTVIDRQQDRLLAKVQERLNDKSYQRGVHLGSKVGRQAYYWNKEYNPMMGIERQAMLSVQTGSTISAPRYAPSGNPIERLAHMGKTAGLTPPEQMNMYRQYGVDPAKNPIVLPDPGRRERMKGMLPGYV